MSEVEQLRRELAEAVAFGDLQVEQRQIAERMVGAADSSLKQRAEQAEAMLRGALSREVNLRTRVEKVEAYAAALAEPAYVFCIPAQSGGVELAALRQMRQVLADRPAAVAEILARLEREMRATEMLDRHQFTGGWEGYACPECGRGDHHAEDCGLERLLKGDK